MLGALKIGQTLVVSALKLKKSGFRGQQSAQSSGVCWAVEGVNSNFVIQAFAEYYGMHVELIVWDASQKKKLKSFGHVGLSDIKNNTEAAQPVLEFLKSQG